MLSLVGWLAYLNVFGAYINSAHKAAHIVHRPGVNLLALRLTPSSGLANSCSGS